ncbi:cysteine-rich KTR domain-containing protein [Streptococcus alactolyticus]
MKCEWILCPVCGSKTRNKIRKDTVLENYPPLLSKMQTRKID